MKFSDLPQGYFVVIKQGQPSLLLAKDGQGRVRLAAKYELLNGHGVEPDTEVQPVYLKKEV